MIGSEYRVEMRGISKHFGGILALQNVDLHVRHGEILALMGENGAGKSTLVKILSGVYHKDSGDVLIDGEHVDISNSHDARARRIQIIHQEFSLAPDLTVGENIFLDRLAPKGVFIRWNELFAESEALLDSVGFRIDPRIPVSGLSVAQQQMVEIAKALKENASVLILDEPTAVLAPQETESLHRVLLRLRERGVSIVYISHRITEVMALSDRITVLKDGLLSGTVVTRDTSAEQLIQLMVGRTFTALFPKKLGTLGDVVLECVDLRSGDKVRDVSFSVRAGEVLGVSGLVGAGKTEMARVVYGADDLEHGSVFLDGKRIHLRSPAAAVRHGIAYLPEDRKKHGVILPLPISENLTIAGLRRVTGLLGFLNRIKEREIVDRVIRLLSIKAAHPGAPVSSLSGGNQQKVSIGKWFNTDFKVLILDEPTRGVDVGAKVEMYSIIRELTERDVAIIMISSEMEEIIGMSDRVMVMHEGSVSGFLSVTELSEANLMRLAVGHDLRSATG
jgi:ribose transport system ATP-binding protein